MFGSGVALHPELAKPSSGPGMAHNIWSWRYYIYNNDNIHKINIYLYLNINYEINISNIFKINYT